MEDIALRSDGRTLRAALAVPDEASHPPPWPGVVVLHELFGLTDDIRGFAQRFAYLGYLAIAPSLYSGGSKARCVARVVRALATGEGESFEDIDAARRLLATDPRCTGRVGVIGFCMGGGFALLSAARMEFAAASVNYGRLPGDLDRALAGACPIVASYGGKDRMLPRAADKLREALDGLGVESDVKEYPAAGHSFLNHHEGVAGVLVRAPAAGFHAESAQDAWRRIVAFFDQHLR